MLLKGPFVFLVVSENELLAEIIKQEQKLYNLFKEAVDGLDMRKKQLELEIGKLSGSNPDLVFMAVRADQARKQLGRNGRHRPRRAGEVQRHRHRAAR